MLMKSHFRKSAIAIGSVLACAGLAANAAPVAVGEPGETVVTGDPSRYGGPSQFRPTFSIPSLKTSFAVGGYVKLDAVYDFDFKQGVTTNPFTLSLKDETDGRFEMFAYQSRLNLRSSTETEIGRINTLFEWDFFPNGELNLRHAYGTVGHWLFGQTWSNAWSSIGSLRSVKYGSPAGSNWSVRQAQVRYVTQMGDEGLFAVSLEDSVDPVIVGVAEVGQPLPDFTARYEYGRLLSLAGVVRQLETASGDESATGFGVRLNMQYPLLSSTTLKATGWWGEGIATYVPGGSTAGPRSLRDAYVEADGSLETVQLVGGSIGIEHAWTEEWSSTLGYSFVQQDDIPVGDFIEDTQYALASLWWEPTPRFAWAVEYQWADVTHQNGGPERNASRIQTSAILQF